MTQAAFQQTMTQGAYQRAMVGVYGSRENAERAVRLLEQAGIPFQAISVIGRDDQAAEALGGGFMPPHAAERGSQGDGTMLGAGMGGVFGFLVGLGSLLIPGVGLAFVLGPLAGATLGTFMGGAWGWLFGDLEYDDNASQYRAHLSAGRFLVIAHLTWEQEAAAQAALQSSGQVHLQTHSVAQGG